MSDKLTNTNCGDGPDCVERVSLLSLFRKGGWYRVATQSFRRETSWGTQLLMHDMDSNAWVFSPHAAVTSYDREEYGKLRTALNSINHHPSSLG